MNSQRFIGRTATAFGMLVVCLGAAACSGDNVQPMSPSFGDAYRQDMARQIVNPDPPTPTPEEAAVDGERIVLGVDAYKKGKVKQPQAISTEQSSGSSGGGGGVTVK